MCVITYHGDNNKSDVDPSTSFGNKWLLSIFMESDRKNTVPILLFKSVDDEGGPKGVKKFIGVAVPAISESGSPIYWLDTSSGYSNYVFKMRVLDTGSTDLRQWLNARCFDYNSSFELSPNPWKEYTGGSEVIDVISDSGHRGHAVNGFMNYLLEKGFYYSPEFLESFLLGLKAKKFMIFCGGTGTGKTKLAQLYCDYIGAEYNIIPVGSNWTDSKYMMGYKNAITGKYEKTCAVKLIEESNQKRDKPFFLILDEMNLSHIERYFSEFISVMESGKPLLLPDGEVISLGRNLFIVGTMNLDETTYSISPKVLDRANVMLFEPADVSSYLNGPEDSISFKGDVNYLNNCMLPLDLQDCKARKLLSEIGNQEIASFLSQLQNCMKEMGLPLGYRSIDEVARFLYAAWRYEMGSDDFDWRPYMCWQIMMKVLPKIHGDVTIKPGLTNLNELLLSYPKMNEAAEHVRRMISNLEVRRYTSFIS